MRTGDRATRVEAAISLLEYGGLGTFHGLDFQVNDASNGARTSIRNWAEPKGVGYQTTARWGVGQLVGPVADPEHRRRRASWACPSGACRSSPCRASGPSRTWTSPTSGSGTASTSPTRPDASTWIRKADVGHELTVVVTASAAGYEPVSAASPPVQVRELWQHSFIE